MAKVKAHQDDVTRWRELESIYRLKGEMSPQTHHVIFADDTEALGLPHLTNRPVKSTAMKSRPHFVPWLYEDVSHQQLRYVYSLKGQHSKGANRWCTMIYHIMKGLKSSGGPTAGARTFVFIGDNYSENKNNINLAFLSDIVRRNWYDEILLLFGPVGHTHNGIDAVHKVHNQNLGLHNAGTLADWISLYPQAWTTLSKRPAAGICTALFDFKGYYDGRIDPIKGFTKTANDKGTVQAWRIIRSNLRVEVQWKPAATLNSPWLGVDGTEVGPRNPGFLVLRKGDSGAPVLISDSSLGERVDHVKKMRRDLNSDAMEAVLTAEDMLESRAWLNECIDTGTIPVHHAVDRSLRGGQVGRLVEIGVPGATVEVLAMQDSTSVPAATADEFFSLPKEVELHNILRQRLLQEMSTRTSYLTPVLSQAQTGDRAVAVSRSQRKQKNPKRKQQSNVDKENIPQQNKRGRPAAVPVCKPDAPVSLEVPAGDFIGKIRDGHYAAVLAADCVCVVRVTDVRTEEGDERSFAGHFCGDPKTQGDAKNPDALNTGKWHLCWRVKAKPHDYKMRYCDKKPVGGTPYVNEVRFDSKSVIYWGEKARVLTAANKLTRDAKSTIISDDEVRGLWEIA